VIHKLFERLPKGDHTLVLFDINHNFDRNNVVRSSVSVQLEKLRETTSNGNYRFELISNIHTKNNSIEKIVDHQKPEPLPYQWPKGLYSLSHLALPISPDDPLYGNENAPQSPGIQLGHLAVYGETGVLQISPSSLLRARWNPFHEYVKKRVSGFLEDKEK